jgi:hypothetical protein
MSFWNKDMSRCKGFSNELQLEGDIDAAKTNLPCYPSTVVYGHTASRGFDPDRWTMGLDSGCVYGRRLTALVLGRDIFAKKLVKDDIEEDDDFEDDEAPPQDIEVERKKSKVRFGQGGHGRIVSVSCS